MARPADKGDQRNVNRRPQLGPCHLQRVQRGLIRVGPARSIKGSGGGRRAATAWGLVTMGKIIKL